MDLPVNNEELKILVTAVEADSPGTESFCPRQAFR